MPKTDFYLLNTTEPTAAMLFACRLAEKAYQQQHRIYFHMSNINEAHLLDEILWTWQEESFLPHSLYGEGPEPTPPIQIGANTTPENHSDILINLSQELADFYQKFDRILEIIPADATSQASARERYKIYRDQQYNLKIHKQECESTHE